MGEPALKICCDTGLSLLDLLETGVDVPNRDAPLQAPWEIQRNRIPGLLNNGGHDPRGLEWER